MRTRLDMLPPELRFNTQLRRSDEMVIDEGVIELLDELYTENQSYLPDILLQEDEKEKLRLFASKLQALFRMDDEVPITPEIEHEAFFFPISVAHILESRALYPRISTGGERATEEVSDEDRAFALRDSVEMYLDTNPAVTGLIASHLDQLGIEDMHSYEQKPVSMIMAGYAFLAIETLNLRYYKDELILRRIEQQF